ncbi:COG3904 family protein [Cucumibacter marinus]|uniref:COG3904 family protein n=1 Tax=Cucumibacter marinus TaxID=1121252 RepID=UPI00041B9EAD|nr:hypothetical protein [Cucumibacter marinus]
MPASFDLIGPGVAALALVLTTAVLPAAAADIALQTRQSNQISPGGSITCNFTLSGVILRGDADRFLAVAEGIDYETANPFVCLDSPGGSLAEAVKLARAINRQGISTYVGPGARCESACSIAFLGGGYAEEGNVIPQRYIHNTARLGFHAPALELPAGTYTDAEVTQAYAVALQSVSATMNELMMDGRMAVSLLGVMLDTPPADMTYVDTIDKAGRWAISILPSAARLPLDPAVVARGCANLLAWQNDDSAIIPDYGPRSTELDSDFSLTRLDAGEESVARYRIEFFGMYLEGCEFSIPSADETISHGTVWMNTINDIGFSSDPHRMSIADYLDPRTRLADLP